MGRHPETTLERASTGNLSVAELLASGLREEIGEAPQDFNQVERGIWDRYSAEMKRLGFADRSQRMSLELLCRTYSDWMLQRAIVTKQGNTILVQGTRGPSEIINPAIKAAKDCRTNINTFLIELNLTPKAQSKAKPPKIENENHGPAWEGM